MIRTVETITIKILNGKTLRDHIRNDSLLEQTNIQEIEEENS